MREKGKGKTGGKAPKRGQYCHSSAKTGKRPRAEKFGVCRCIFARLRQAQVDVDKWVAAAEFGVLAIGMDGWDESPCGVGCVKGPLTLVNIPGNLGAHGATQKKL